MLLVLLAGGGGATTVAPTPTAPASGGPQRPYHRPLPDSTVLHVGISFKLNQQVIDQLNTRKVPKGQKGWDYASGIGSPNLPDFFKTLLLEAKQS